VACNTASALALPAIRGAVRCNVIGVIEPGARAAVEVAGRTQRKRVGVIATESTVNSGVYSTAIGKLDPQAVVLEHACPLFVSLAEEGWADSEVARSVANEYLAELKQSGIDSLVLGCTHYPILRGVIQSVIGPDVKLIDSGEAAARDVQSWLVDSELAHPSRENSAPERRLCDDLDHFYVTDAAERFARVAERFLGHPPSVLEAVEVWGHDELRTV
jgi:glutamate racemase